MFDGGAWFSISQRTKFTIQDLTLNDIVELTAQYGPMPYTERLYSYW